MLKRFRPKKSISEKHNSNERTTIEKFIEFKPNFEWNVFFRTISKMSFGISFLLKMFNDLIQNTMLNYVKIKAYQVALVYKNRNLIEILKEGNYWLYGNKTVNLYEMKDEFAAGEDVKLLLKNQKLAEMLDVIEVLDGEIALLYENGIFKKVLTTGIYAYWKGVVERKFQKADLTKVEITEAISKTILENAILRNFTRKFVVANQNKAILFVDGKMNRALESGTYYFWNNEIAIEVKSTDMRSQQMEITGQELLTKDKAALRINFYVRYEVKDIVKALVENKDYDKQLYVLMQLALREFVGALSLDELLVKKDALGKEILSNFGNKGLELGLQVSDAGIRDVILTGEMKDIMNQVLIAEKKAQANSIMRREETASTRSMLNTAKLMEENEVLWKLKEMEYMEKIADKIGDITLSGNSNIVNQLKEIFSK